MKKIIYSIILAGVVTIGFTSCGGAKKEEAQEEKTEEAYDDYETAQPETKESSPEDLVAQGQVLVDASDCKTCHHSTNKLIGPPHMDVAKKYEFNRANITLLAGKIINGGSGVWGEIPMSPHPDLSQGDAEKMSIYVLSLDGEKLQD